MSEPGLFESLSDPIPPVRRDLHLIPIQDNGKEWIFFYDDLGYLSTDFALDQQAGPVLSLLTGTYSVEQITDMLNGGVSPDDLLIFIRLLDQHCVLESEYYRFVSNQIETGFEEKEIRQPALAGKSYPENPDELAGFVDQVMDHAEPETETIPLKALFAPHIDLRVGNVQYAGAFSLLRHQQPERVILLATSHYAGFYGKHYDGFPFIGTTKDFLLPGKEIKTCSSVMKSLAASSRQNGFTLNDRAHRIEHSIEVHLLFLSSLWKHNFEIIPILVAGLDDLFYHRNGELSKKTDRFCSQLRALDEPGTLFLISGDLSHVGKKFGDSKPAQTLRKTVEPSDKQFLQLACEGDPKKLLDYVALSYDATRICGFPPLYTYLRAFPEYKGDVINYFWWNERERESAVSFGSIGFR